MRIPSVEASFVSLVPRMVSLLVISSAVSLEAVSVWASEAFASILVGRTTSLTSSPCCYPVPAISVSTVVSLGLEGVDSHEHTWV